MIEALAAAGVHVTVICHAGDSQLPPRVPGIEWILPEGNSRSRFGSLASRDPSIVYRSVTPAVRRAASVHLERQSWDVVVIDSIAMAGVVRAADISRGTKLVYFSHNHEETVRRDIATVASRSSLHGLALRLDAIKARRAERQLVDEAELITTITAEDADLFHRRDPNKTILVLPPGYDGANTSHRTIAADTPRRVILLGSFLWIAKQMNLRRFLDSAAVTLDAAGIGIDVVGEMPASLARELRASYRGTRIVGAVERLEPYLNEARLGIVAEEIGGGFKLKVLDYVFTRTPIAALSGALAGTPLKPGLSFLRLTSQDAMASEIAEMIDNFDGLNAMQEAAYAACEGRFEWSDRGRTLATALADLG